MSSGSAINFNSHCFFQYDFGGPKKCKNCNRTLEQYGKKYSNSGAVYDVGWHPIPDLVSPVSNLCVSCYEAK